jgi:hypothetical protein
MPPPRPGNDEIADVLERIGDLLEAQHGGPYRVRAYRSAAESLRGLTRPAVDILEAEGRPGLEKLPGIGKSIAALVAEYAHGLRVGLLERLEGQISPEDLFTTVPGIGEELAARIHSELGVETLEELELAAHDGRLAKVPGMGPRRVLAVRDSLATVLRRSTRRRARRMRWLEAGRAAPELPVSDHDHERPSVAALLAVDEEYRRRAEAGELHTIPVLHCEREGWSFTALFSNTARAHELGRTRDWVVIYWERDGHEDQCTVVTERRGPLAGRRVVRGRESETPKP